MPRKKTATSPAKPAPALKKPAMSKTALVKSLPSSTPGAEVVKKAKEAGLNISLGYVYSIRAKANTKRKPKAVGTTATSVKRGPGRPPKVASYGGASSSGLVGEIEKIIECRVNELLKERLSALFAGG